MDKEEPRQLRYWMANYMTYNSVGERVDHLKPILYVFTIEPNVDKFEHFHLTVNISISVKHCYAKIKKHTIKSGKVGHCTPRSDVRGV